MLLMKNYSRLIDKLLQRRATKYILNDFKSDYKSRLISLNLLPLTTWLEMQDVVFFIKCLKEPSDNFDIFQYVSFSSSCTRATSNKRMIYNKCNTTKYQHFYFNRIARIWNALPSIDTTGSMMTIKRRIKQIFWSYFLQSFDVDNICSWNISCPCPLCSITPVQSIY